VAACRSPPDSVKHLEAEPFISHDLNTNRLFRVRTFPNQARMPFPQPDCLCDQSRSGTMSKRSRQHSQNAGKNYHTHHRREVRNDRRHADRKSKPALHTPRNGVKLLIFQSSHLLGEGHVSTPSRNTRCNLPGASKASNALV
jgi:hypothetical protein